MAWIDHLRTFVILLVICMHACVTYSHVGGWYIMSEHEPTLAAKVPFIIWQATLQSFFMGLMFFIAGFFATKSLRRRGFASFLRERTLRLGAPVLLYMLAVHPFILLAINPWHAHWPPPAEFYRQYLLSGKFIGSTGPAWFAFALLIFCFVFAGWRKIKPETEFSEATLDAPKTSALLVFALCMGAGSFLVRLVQPLGSDIYNMQLAYFPQYIAAFTAGVYAERGGWLVSLAQSALARRWGWFGLLLGPLSLLGLLLVGGKEGVAMFMGGWHWQAAALAFWEQFTGVALSLGLMHFFLVHLNQDRPLLRWASDQSFAVYILHAPVLIWLYLVFLPLPQHAAGLAFLMTVVGGTMTFLFVTVIRKIPAVRAIL